ncbi:hypothetical protein A7P53_03180 [Acinetobacter defluvii]|uniref:Uncharacterized protein n=1 Tax=Acinetobacter defluvii TaxID=1871111 RepID=A0A2S2FCT7_9GAMM|nr:hypothetical protein [Acinetobacter defluvii]AWL28718.1 hypothetical protein DJ533_09125 [Acinetobacter defluvii]NNP71457.1 hypothetical protein [Acinetobacter defluvii]
MPLKFILRFAVILFFVVLLDALVIQFLFSGSTVVILWILTVPVILGIPILMSVLLASDEEMEIPKNI